MIASVYARKSTAQDGVSDDQKSVARQVEHATAYAERKGWTVSAEYIYVDDGISGAEFANRPGFLRLMNALKPRAPFQVLVMSEESRLGREAIETAYALKQLVTAGVRVFFYMEDRERTLDSPTDKIMMSLTAFADELERDRARLRTYDALSRKARARHVTGGSVFGYRNREVIGPDGRRSHVERDIDEAQATVVREIFDLCARGFGKRAIAKHLNERAAPSPRAQLGRPQSWAPSSVREALYRDLYRGEITWNKTKKRDSWGVKHQRPRPESEWLRLPTPALRIVSDEAWAAAHARLDATRQTYLRTQGGRLWGRPPDGLAGKYLLTGIARCGVCGGGLEVRSRKLKARQREYFYSCSSFYRRGPTVCPNRYEIPMATADAAIRNTLLDELLTPDRLAGITDRLLARAQAAHDNPVTCEADIKSQIVTAETALGRLTAAVAAGGDVPALVTAIKAQDEQRRALQRRLDTLQQPAVAFDRDLERRLRASVGEWREALGRQVAQARQIVTKLLSSKLTFTPECRDDQDGFTFRAIGTVTKLVAGVVPGDLCLQGVTSPPGIEDFYTLIGSAVRAA